jgi:hypothetical protein
MQWQLDKRTHDGTSGTNSSTHAKHAARKRKLVFHDRHSRQTQHTHQAEHHRQQRRQHQTATASSSDGSDSSGASNSTLANAGSGTEAALGIGVGAGQQEVGDTAAGSEQREDQFFCLQLDHAGAALDLQKAQERLAKHIQQVRLATCVSHYGCHWHGL